MANTEKVCTMCNNLSENCSYCGGTNLRKEKTGIRICPACNNQNDYCTICGGNVRLQWSEDDGDQDNE